jgi:hypothetical protein
MCLSLAVAIVGSPFSAHAEGLFNVWEIKREVLGQYQWKDQRPPISKCAARLPADWFRMVCQAFQISLIDARAPTHYGFLMRRCADSLWVKESQARRFPEERPDPSRPGLHRSYGSGQNGCASLAPEDLGGRDPHRHGDTSPVFVPRDVHHFEGGRILGRWTEKRRPSTPSMPSPSNWPRPLDRSSAVGDPDGILQRVNERGQSGVVLDRERRGRGWPYQLPGAC